MQLNEPILVLVDRFLSEQSNEKSSKDLYRKTLHLFINWMVINDQPVKEPKIATFVLYKEGLLKRNLSVRTIDSYLTSVKLFFKWLIENELYNINISAKHKSLRKSSDYIRASLTVDQVQELLSSSKGSSLVNKRNYAILNIMIFLGLRRIEVCRLNIGDLYFEESQWYIRIHGKGRFEKDAELPITENIIQPIQEYWRLRSDGDDTAAPAFVNHARRSTGRIAPIFISKMVKAKLRSIGLNDPKYTGHSLRHTCATLSLKAGSKVHEIQQLLRQRNTSTTELYLKTIREERVSDGTAVFNLDRYFKEQKKTGINQ